MFFIKQGQKVDRVTTRTRVTRPAAMMDLVVRPIKAIPSLVAGKWPFGSVDWVMVDKEIHQ